MEVTAAPEMFAMSETRPVNAGLRGEAVALDLPDGPVFAILEIRNGGPFLFSAVTDALSPIEGRVPRPSDLIAQIDSLGSFWSGRREADLKRENWPMIVRFGDLRDPKTAEVVAPESVGITRVRVETTSDPITVGLAKRLPWLVPLGGRYLHGGPTSRGAPAGLDGAKFSTEIDDAE
jgi:hypothetical protein